MVGRILKWIGIILLIGLIIGAGYFLIWTGTPLGPMDEALDALQGNSHVSVSQKNDNYYFTPSNLSETNHGIIFYPGGRVDYRSYSVLALGLATAGYFVAIVKVRFNLAILQTNVANEVLYDQSSISRWTAIGHSLGGAAAGVYIDENPTKFLNLILLASNTADANDISDLNINVLMVNAELDTVINSNTTQKRELLPPDHVYVEIEGGNHAGFGYYGSQNGDTPAEISRETQHQITLLLILNFLSS